MLIKVQLSYPKKQRVSKVVEIEVEDGLVQTEVEDWLRTNRKKILKDHGCDLDDHELSSAFALSSVTVRLIYGNK